MIRLEIFEGAELIRQRRLDEAIGLLRSLADSDLDKEEAGMKHLHLAIAFKKKTDVERSAYHYGKAIEYDHPTGIAYEHLAILLTKQGDLDGAIKVCQRLIDHPTIPEARSYLTKGDMEKRRDKLVARLTKKNQKDERATNL